MRHWTAAIAALALGLPAPPAASEVYFLRPEPFSADDSSPYSFIPLLVRGFYPNLYTHEADDSDGLSHDMRAFLRFPLPDFAPGERVTEAYLVLAYSFSFDHFGVPPNLPVSAAVAPVLEPWSQFTLHWENQPPAGEVVDAVEGITSFRLIELDVTAIVRDWATGALPNHGFRITNDAARPMGFYSWEPPPGTDPILLNSLLIATEFDGDADGDGIDVVDDNCPGVANADQLDGDTDDVGDVCDNCLAGSNASQLDSDLDGYGNACDADYTGDSVVGGPDLLMLTGAFGAGVGEPGYDERLDADGDGVIGGPDLLMVGGSFGGAPGPSGHACAGTAPCTSP